MLQASVRTSCPTRVQEHQGLWAELWQRYKDDNLTFKKRRERSKHKWINNLCTPHAYSYRYWMLNNYYHFTIQKFNDVIVLPSFLPSLLPSVPLILNHFFIFSFFPYSLTSSIFQIWVKHLSQCSTVTQEVLKTNFLECIICGSGSPWVILIKISFKCHSLQNSFHLLIPH